MTDNLLLVEDEEGVAECVKAILGGWQIDWAADGVTALTLWAAKKYAVVIVDLVLPGPLQGMDIIRAMKAKEPQVAEFIILTGYPGSESEKEAITLEVGDYIVKPPSVTHLRHSVEMAKTRVLLREGRLGLEGVKRQVDAIEKKVKRLERR